MPYLEKAGIHIGSLGDAGEMLDDQAKVAYRRRLSELREELEGLGGAAFVGFRRDGMPGGRAYSRDFQLPDETCRRIRSRATSVAFAGGAQLYAVAPRRRLAILAIIDVSRPTSP